LVCLGERTVRGADPAAYCPASVPGAHRRRSYHCFCSGPGEANGLPYGTDAHNRELMVFIFTKIEGVKSSNDSVNYLITHHLES
jgi:hypothetical protein